MGTNPLQVDGVDPAVLDAAFRAQSDATRRHLLEYLDERGDAVAVSDLAEDLATALDDGGASACAPDGEAVSLNLHHVHLPKLEATGLVEVAEGPTGRTVRLSEGVRRVRSGPLFLPVDE
jgi:DNA-binding transcriptional ArsR family regulator